ncbi:MAG: PAS domain-containing protein, partial [Bacteroidales bacterium]|nr:PAS domain-containing protein [Bacteroidales bacterium]
MKNTEKTKEQLLKEIDQLKVKIAELEKSESKRKQVEKALEESEKQLQTLIDAMPDFVCFKDGDGYWLKANNASISIFQLEDIDYRGKKDSELAELNSKLRGSFLTCKETDARVWKEGGLIHGEETVPDSDGSVRVFDVTKVPVFHPDGEPKGLVVIGHDITERKQAEESLIKSEKQYRSLIDALPQYIYFLDKNLRYVAANKAYCEEYSIDQEEIIGKTSKDFSPEKLAEKYMASDREVIETGKVKEYTEKSKSTGNEDKWVQVVKVPVKDNNGNVDGMLGVYWDITDLRQSEEELAKHGQHLEDLVKERTAELEGSQKALSFLLEDVNDAREDVERTNKKLIEANKELESFSYSVSHDLKAPLRAIDGYANAIMEDYYEKLDNEGKELLNLIHKNVKNMDQLIKDLLEFSRIGRTVLVISGIDMKSLLNDVFMEIYQFIPDRKIQLKIKDFHPAKSDKRLLQQVFLNLMTNAMKFTSNEKNAIIEAGSRI